MSSKAYDLVKDRAKDAMGGKRAFWIMGSSIRRAFIADQILNFLYLQDESISDSTVRKLLDDLKDEMAHDPELLD